MSLPLPDSPREYVHTRALRVDVFSREDGLWDLEAHLQDIKGYDFPKQNGSMHPAGKPVHDMRLRVTIDEGFTIKAAVAAYEAAPYNQTCFAIAPSYEGLVGMNLLRGFRHAVKEKFGRTAGCTHLTELSYLLPTVAIQSRAGQRRKSLEETVIDSPDPASKPFQLEGCHALRLDGEAVKEFYPKWYTGAAAPDAQDEDAGSLKSSS